MKIEEIVEIIKKRIQQVEIEKKKACESQEFDTMVELFGKLQAFNECLTLVKCLDKNNDKH